jgi:RNA polymerase sigma-70 factor (ECF subfamily)
VKFFSLSGTDDDVGHAEAAGQTAELAARRNPPPDEAASRKETVRAVTDALNELDEEFRVVVVLRDIEGMNYGEIAEVLDLPTGTVKSRLHRARNMLREKLTDLVI